MKIHSFTFGPFSENTYVLEDENSKEGIIIDPGMYDDAERNLFKQELNAHGILPKLLLNTHCHIDHVMGNRFILDEYGLLPQGHELAVQTLSLAERSAEIYGFNYDPSPELATYLKHNDLIEFNGHSLSVYFCPGHAPGHVVFYNAKESYVIGGDVLFLGSVGRVDLPGSVPKDLENSILNTMYKLPDDTIVYSGHGPSTTIGYEKKHNTFVNENGSRLS